MPSIPYELSLDDSITFFVSPDVRSFSDDSFSYATSHLFVVK